MPTYDYHCPANGLTVTVVHSLDAQIRCWFELCYASGEPLGETDPHAPVHRVLAAAPGVHTPAGNAELKGHGLTKLVKRDDGVYENVTATDGEARYVRPGESSTYPKFEKKVRD